VTSGLELDAGPFASWLRQMQAALAGSGDSDVPCDGCTACCESSQFVHIAPDEVDTLAHVPAALLFPAPGLSAGHVVLGYDGDGRCPMLSGAACTIYAHRPRACRVYDCRIFAATDVEVGEPEVASRVRRWRFEVDAGDGPVLTRLRTSATEVGPIEAVRGIDRNR
jgi:uncharacterized protein